MCCRPLLCWGEMASEKQLEEKLNSLSPRSKSPKTMVMKDLASPRKTHLLTRGQYDLKGKEVTPGVLAVLNPLPNDAPQNRLGLAKWLVDSKNPLTARVAVNRHWQMLFGTGLVKSLEDFGTQGELPSHPALLDTLANEFVKSKWNVKGLLRLILTSAAYRQSSQVSSELLERDPHNRLMARGPRFRLDAEQVRDQALAISGLLSQNIGGPSVYPYQPKGLWMELNNRPGYSREYVAGQRRRALSKKRLHLLETDSTFANALHFRRAWTRVLYCVAVANQHAASSSAIAARSAIR